ncbi:MAG: rod shape-determining protein RodA [Acidobacteria bacterium]|nr:rod shape-determining protein RodA [Acidobacteriota bacterium]
MIATMANQNRRWLVDFDWWLLLAALALTAISVTEIFSSQPNSDFWFKQMIWVGLGLTAMIPATVIDYRRMAPVAPLFYGGSVVLLVLVLIFGKTINGARAWFDLWGFGIQPSELAKVTTIFALSVYLARQYEQKKNKKETHLSLRDMAVAGLIVLLPVLLIIIQPDTGTALTFIPVLVGALFVTGIRPRWILLSALVLVVAIAVGWHYRYSILKTYQLQRIETLLHPDQADRRGYGWQTYQSKIAVGSGGPIGKGITKSTQSRLKFLPYPHTDFIASVVAEETGFLGMMVLLGLYMFVLLRSLGHAERARDQLGVILITGVVSLFGFHMMINVGMVVGLLPIMGIPLPLVSYGGSSIITAFVALGLIANVRLHRHVN